MNPTVLDWWLQGVYTLIPKALARRWHRLTPVLGDGRYLVRSPVPAALAPFVLAVAGIVCGRYTRMDVDFYTGSLWMMMGFILVGNLSALLGLWLVGVYSLVNFLLPHVQYFSSWDPKTAHQAALSHLALPIPYTLLLVLVVFIPLASRRLMVTWGRKTGELSVLVEAILQAALVFFWTQCVPIMIRPVWVWAGSLPTTPMIEPVQRWCWVLAATAFLATFLRKGAEALATRSGPLDAPTIQEPTAAPSTGKKVLCILGIGYFLSGAFTHVWEAVLSALLIGSIHVWRGAIARLLPWAVVIQRIPLLWRIGVALVLSFGLSYAIIQKWESLSNTDAFTPLLVPILLSQMLFLALIPNVRSSSSQKP